MSGASGNQSNSAESNILDDDAERLARRIRQERIARSWSLAEMSNRSGVSRAMIHRVESGASSPTATLLGKISGALQISMPALFRGTPSELTARLVRSRDRRSWHDPETGYVRDPISSATIGKARSGNTPQITRVTLPPGARVPFPRSAFTFIEQAVWILEGTLHFVEGDTAHQLGPDDCLTLGEPQDCVFENRSGETCVYAVVVS